MGQPVLPHLPPGLQTGNLDLGGGREVGAGFGVADLEVLTGRSATSQAVEDQELLGREGGLVDELQVGQQVWRGGFGLGAQGGGVFVALAGGGAGLFGGGGLVFRHAGLLEPTGPTLPRPRSSGTSSELVNGRHIGAGLSNAGPGRPWPPPYGSGAARSVGAGSAAPGSTRLAGGVRRPS